MQETILIGTWREREPREFEHCPSYYAADHERLRIQPGEYPLRLQFHGGYTVPMPYWLLTTIDTVRVSGALYSGFGGVNYGKTELPAGEAVRYTIQLYVSALRELVATGIVELLPGREWLLEELPWQSERAPKTWEDIA